MSPSRSASAETVDAAPVTDLALVTPVTMLDLPTAHILNTPVTSGSCVSHPVSVVTAYCPYHSKHVSVTASTPTGSKTPSGDRPPGGKALVESSSGAIPGSSVGGAAHLSRKLCGDVWIVGRLCHL